MAGPRKLSHSRMLHETKGCCMGPTWTAVLSPMLVNDDYDPQRAEHVSLPGHTAVLATEPLQLRPPYYGTVFQRTWKRRTYCTVNFGGR